MNKIDWARKLTSRKFWAAIIGFVTPFLVTSGHSSEQVAQITAMIMSGAAVIAYIVGEGLTDAANGSVNAKNDTEKEKENG